MTTASTSPDATQDPTAAESAERLAVVARLTTAARAELGQRPDDLSMRAVARRAGIDPRTVSTYLDSREALVTNVMLEIAFDVHHVLVPAQEATSGAATRTRLLALARAFRGWALANPADYWTLMGPRKRITFDRGAIVRGLRWFYGPVMEICREGVESGQVDVAAAAGVERTAHLVHPAFSTATDDPRVVAQTVNFMAGLHGYLILESCGQVLVAAFTDADQAFEAHVGTLLDAAGVA